MDTNRLLLTLAKTLINSDMNSTIKDNKNMAAMDYALKHYFDS